VKYLKKLMREVSLFTTEYLNGVHDMDNVAHSRLLICIQGAEDRVFHRRLHHVRGVIKTKPENARKFVSFVIQ
jgi:hypothetical protein